MNIQTTNNTGDPLIYEIAKAICDNTGISSIGELANLLIEVENNFEGDTDSVFDAISAGDLKFEEIHQPNAWPNAWVWHIKASRQ
jgi:hypothetical protein